MAEPSKPRQVSEIVGDRAGKIAAWDRLFDDRMAAQKAKKAEDAAKWDRLFDDRMAAQKAREGDGAAEPEGLPGEPDGEPAAEQPVASPAAKAQTERLQADIRQQVASSGPGTWPKAGVYANPHDRYTYEIRPDGSVLLNHPVTGRSVLRSDSSDSRVQTAIDAILSQIKDGTLQAGASPFQLPPKTDRAV